MCIRDRGNSVVAQGSLDATEQEVGHCGKKEWRERAALPDVHLCVEGLLTPPADELLFAQVELLEEGDPTPREA
eukprot:818390-Alexandrium_andersonii.AAC.1